MSFYDRKYNYNLKVYTSKNILPHIYNNNVRTCVSLSPRQHLHRHDKLMKDEHQSYHKYVKLKKNKIESKKLTQSRFL